MDPHLDNRSVFGVVIVNLKDNPAGSGTTILDQFRQKQIYQGPTEKGTGILLFNNWNTWHMIANNSEENRLVSYYTLSIDHMNIDN